VCCCFVTKVPPAQHSDDLRGSDEHVEAVDRLKRVIIGYGKRTKAANACKVRACANHCFGAASRAGTDCSSTCCLLSARSTDMDTHLSK
jgi:hypothetical protein